jgi:hypothetical protein
MAGGDRPAALKGGGSKDLIEAEIQTTQAWAKRIGQIQCLNRLRKMQTETARGIDHHLLQSRAAGWS